MKLAITTLLAAAVAALLFSTASASSTTSRAWPMPPGWHAPPSWLGHPSSKTSRSTGAWCIHDHEGAWNAATENGYEGGLQFLRSTWERAGGSVDRKTGHWASVASPREQLYRAWIVWKADGHSFREWGTAAECGLA